MRRSSRSSPATSAPSGSLCLARSSSSTRTPRWTCRADSAEAQVVPVVPVAQAASQVGQAVLLRVARVAVVTAEEAEKAKPVARFLRKAPRVPEELFSFEGLPS